MFLKIIWSLEMNSYPVITLATIVFYILRWVVDLIFFGEGNCPQSNKTTAKNYTHDAIPWFIWPMLQVLRTGLCVPLTRQEASQGMKPGGRHCQTDCWHLWLTGYWFIWLGTVEPIVKTAYHLAIQWSSSLRPPQKWDQPRMGTTHECCLVLELRPPQI